MLSKRRILPLISICVGIIIGCITGCNESSKEKKQLSRVEITEDENYNIVKAIYSCGDKQIKCAKYGEIFLQWHCTYNGITRKYPLMNHDDAAISACN